MSRKFARLGLLATVSALAFTLVGNPVAIDGTSLNFVDNAALAGGPGNGNGNSGNRGNGGGNTGGDGPGTGNGGGVGGGAGDGGAGSGGAGSGGAGGGGGEGDRGGELISAGAGETGGSVVASLDTSQWWYELGHTYVFAKNEVALAVPPLCTAAKQGNAEAQFLLGSIFAGTIDDAALAEKVPADYAQAYKWYSVATATGHVCRTVDESGVDEEKEALAKKMSPRQKTNADTLIRYWKTGLCGTSDAT